MKKRMTAVLVLFCMLICVRGIVFAAQSEPAAAGPDLSKECSIVVHLFTFDKEPVTDGSAMLIQVAELTEDGFQGVVTCDAILTAKDLCISTG